jgi:7-carboxy-7-deazaguanine synthase
MTTKTIPHTTHPLAGTAPEKNPPHGLVPSTVAFPKRLQKTQAPVQEIFSSIQGEGFYAGCRQIFVRFAHCHLHCAYCDTPMTTPSGQCAVEWQAGSDSWEQLENPLQQDRLVGIIQQLLSTNGKHHSVSFTGGEPLLYSPFLAHVLPQIQQLGIQTYLETSGTQPHLLTPLLPFLDIVAMDVKLPSATKEAPRWAEHQAFYALLENNPIFSGRVFIKCVFNQTTTLAELSHLQSIVTNPNTVIYLQPETPLVGDTTVLTVNAQQMLTLQAGVSNWFTDVRVLPQTHKFLQVS